MYQGLAEACKPQENADLTSKVLVKEQKASRKTSLEAFNHLPLTETKQNTWFRKEKPKINMQLDHIITGTTEYHSVQH